jgi:hypothetical protein
MDEAQLVEHGWREDEGIPIGQPEAAVEVVEHIGEREPVIEPLRKGAEATALGQGGHGGLVGPQGLRETAQVLDIRQGYPKLTLAAVSGEAIGPLTGGALRRGLCLVR